MSLVRIALVLAVCLADGILLFRAAPAVAADVIADTPPPPPRAENMGHPRDGYVWAPGHWEWQSNAYRWTAGVWIVAHGRSRWVADQWQPKGSQWQFLPGHWEH